MGLFSKLPVVGFEREPGVLAVPERLLIMFVVTQVLDLLVKSLKFVYNWPTSGALDGLVLVLIALVGGVELISRMIFTLRLIGWLFRESVKAT